MGISLWAPRLKKVTVVAHLVPQFSTTSGVVNNSGVAPNDATIPIRGFRHSEVNTYFVVTTTVLYFRFAARKETQQHVSVPREGDRRNVRRSTG